MTRHERALLCCQLADEEERLDELIKHRVKALMVYQKETSQLIDKRDALIVVRRHLLRELK